MAIARLSLTLINDLPPAEEGEVRSFFKDELNAETFFKVDRLSTVGVLCCSRSSLRMQHKSTIYYLWSNKFLEAAYNSNLHQLTIIMR